MLPGYRVLLRVVRCLTLGLRAQHWLWGRNRHKEGRCLGGGRPARVLGQLLGTDFGRVKLRAVQAAGSQIRALRVKDGGKPPHPASWQHCSGAQPSPAITSETAPERWLRRKGVWVTGLGQLPHVPGASQAPLYTEAPGVLGRRSPLALWSWSLFLWEHEFLAG